MVKRSGIEYAKNKNRSGSYLENDEWGVSRSGVGKEELGVRGRRSGAGDMCI